MSQNQHRLREQLIQFTRDLVMIESTNDRPEERRRCFYLIRNHLEEVPGIRLRMLEKNGYESLLAFPDQDEKPTVLLCGHLDVVHHPDPESYQSIVRDGRIYGPGAGDMKGQLAILIQLMRHLGREYPHISVGMAITSDEELGGENGVKFLVEEAGVSCGVAVIPDAGCLTDIIVEEKGILHLRIRSRGVSAHAARPWLGINALEHLTSDIGKIQAAFDKLAPGSVDPDDWSTHWFPTCATTMLSTSNGSPNRIPEEASAVLDIRFTPPRTAEMVLEEVRSHLSEGVETEVIVSAEPTHLAPDELFVKITRDVTQTEPSLVRASGGSDGRFFFGRGIPVILSRPKVGNLHGRDEWIDIDSMVSYYQICREYVLAKNRIERGPGR